MYRRGGFVSAALLAAAVLFSPGGAQACSVCLAGDPMFSSQGATAQPQGSVSAFLQVRGWNKTSGTTPHEGSDGEEEEGFHLPGEERNASQRVDLFVSWTPLDRFTLTLDLPWAFDSITEIDHGMKSGAAIHGFGDVELHATGVLWRNRDVLPSTWLEGRAFVKFPTGRSEQSVRGVADPHLQAGTGSWDFGFGVAGVHRLSWATLFASGSYRVNGPGGLDYEYGDVALANAGIEVPIGHALGCPCLDPLTAGFELNFRYAVSDRIGGERFDDSGGSILYLTPSVRVKLPWVSKAGGPYLRAAVQIPATSAWLHGFQVEDPIWSVGVGHAF